MPTYIFNDSSEFKTHLGGAINQDISMLSLAPWIEMAAQAHIWDWLSQAQWDELVSVVEGGPPTEPQSDLLDKVRRATALLSMYEYIKVGNTQFTEGMGLIRAESDTMKSAYKYQENEYRQQMLIMGYEALEIMLNFLEDNESDYPTWVASTAYARNKSLFINTAQTFRQYYGRQLSRYVYEVIRPIIQEVELFAILRVIGQDQYDDLKQGIALKALTTDEQTLIGLIQQAIVHFSIQEAMARHWIQFQGNRVVQAETLEPQGLERAGSATGVQFSTKYSHHNLFANRNISYILYYLEENLDTFPLYKAYYEERQEEEEEATQDEAAQYYADRNFGAFPIPVSGKKKVTGIKRL